MTNLRVGNGYDVHELKSGYKFLLGGVEIEYTKGIVAHSDGDIVFHSISDALLGAVAMGDIGHFFPDDDPKYKDINSLFILNHILEKLNRLSFVIVNVDVTIVLERPKLKFYIPSIKKSVSKGLKISPGQVNIKATTSEKMGFVGREEGIVCYTTVLIEKI